MAHPVGNMSGNMQGQPPSGGRLPMGLQSLPSLSNLPSPMEVIQLVRNSLRPWSVFFNINNFKSAVSMQRLNNRVLRNLSYFQSNYVFIFFVLMIYCLITAPLILLVIIAAAIGCHKLRSRNTNYTIMGQTLTPSQQIIALNLATAPILFLVGAGSVLFWTLGASCFVIFMHAIFYNIDAIVTEENEGFLAEVV
ncbi:prenylated Rab acceptor protein 1 [Drosophila bipectinata]|uniref:prenylated Rab acceptor protein 1 n=1 Tax=Drosophila bipectinata TaxID=42026 RepID=UPI0007E74CD7|nr:prenylated Rab acceptor protein 1 [Drosophila bipectinata]